jgi:hypothetical protein
VVAGMNPDQNKVVVMTWWRRPAYSRLVAEALCRCWGIEGYRVIIHVEPDCEDVVRLAREFPLPNKDVVVHPTRYGCRRSAFAAFSSGFATGSDFVAYLEDDVVPAPDCLLFFEWARRTYAHDPTIFFAGAFHWNPADEPAAATREPGFTCWGCATWADRWNEMAGKWTFDGVEQGWDHMMATELRRGRDSIQPKLPRMQNIGAELGAFCSDPTWHLDRHYNAVWSGDRPRPPVSEYREVKAPPGRPAGPADNPRPRPCPAP